MRDLKNTIILVNHSKTAQALTDALKLRHTFEVKESPQGSPAFFERRDNQGVIGFCEVKEASSLKNQATWLYRELGVQTLILTGTVQSHSPWPHDNTVLIPDVCVVPVQGSQMPSSLVLFEELYFDADLQHVLRSNFKTFSQSGPIKLLSPDQVLSSEALDWSAQQLGVLYAELLSNHGFKASRATSQKIGAVFCPDTPMAVKLLVQAWISALGWGT